MHEKRNFALILAAVGSFVWAVLSWFVTGSTWQGITATSVFLACGGRAVWAMNFEDTIENHLLKAVGSVYYDADGISFLPTVRQVGNQAELTVFYQNRYENPVECIVHLRPPEDSFIIRPVVRDVHIAFKAGGGDFGVIHQPIAVPRHLQGEVLNIQLAAASWYPRSHGSRLIRQSGMPCGSMLVDWGGNPLKIGVHEVSGELKLTNPVAIHLAMPINVIDYTTGTETWKQEQLVPGNLA